jgi:hypothetical protein
VGLRQTSSIDLGLEKVEPPRAFDKHPWALSIGYTQTHAIDKLILGFVPWPKETPMLF